MTEVWPDQETGSEHVPFQDTQEPKSLVGQNGEYESLQTLSGPPPPPPGRLRAGSCGGKELHFELMSMSILTEAKQVTGENIPPSANKTAKRGSFSDPGINWLSQSLQKCKLFPEFRTHLHKTT